jgi:1-acyl-sn-glycerol-3-phosphate acyltransferase
MARRKSGDTIYYSDVLHDDFLATSLKRPEIPEDYKFKRTNLINNFFSRILYYLIAHPILGMMMLILGTKIKNKKNLKAVKGKGAFLYGNHTTFTDAFKVQAYVVWSRRVNIIGFSDSYSMPIVRNLVRALGYLPLPESLEGQIRLIDSLKFYIKDKKQYVLIYPEAHIWPYYTKIRPFVAASFHYPAKLMAPIIPMVTTYRKPLFKGLRPRETIWIGEAIFPKVGASIKENKDYLREECYKQMEKISSSVEQYETYRYIYREKKE